MPRKSSKPVPTTSAGRARAGRTSAFDAGLRMIVGRDHSVSELRRKLIRRGYLEEEIDAAQQRLMEHGFLGDKRFAERYARRRSRSLGPLAISAELAARGVDRDLVDAAIQRLGPDTEILAAHKLADKLAGNTRYASYRELLHSVGAKLLRRGFSMDIARKACDDLWRVMAEPSELDPFAPV